MDADKIVSAPCFHDKSLNTDCVVDGPRCWSSCQCIASIILEYFTLTVPQVEFDKPSELLKKEGGKLRALVDESGDKEHLYDMANSAA